MGRKKTGFLLAAAITAIIGVTSRSPVADVLPVFIRIYAGDTLWALALFLFFGFLFPSASPARLFLMTLVVSVAVEISQLYQADWINAVRGTRIGGLVLGYGFKCSDLACYAAGAVLGVLLDRFFKRG